MSPRSLTIFAAVLCAGFSAPAQARFPTIFDLFAPPADQSFREQAPDRDQTGPERYRTRSAAYNFGNPDEDAPVAQRTRIPREIVSYDGRQAPGTVVVNTSERRLYLVMPGGRAMRYGIGVGREGFTWSGVQTISSKQEWPEWRPPAEMLKRRPDLPRYMAGGPENPLGARALYLGNTMFRIHGSNEPDTIGQAVSSGCIRMLNDDVVDLYNRVHVGTKVVVLR